MIEFLKSLNQGAPRRAEKDFFFFLNFFHFGNNGCIRKIKRWILPRIWVETLEYLEKAEEG
jgi:hypothetical protein